VVLLDVMMPGMDGFEVCRRLRADPLLSPIPIVMLTALDDRASRLLGLETGADDFLSKPYDSLELRARVRTIVRLNRFRQLFEQRARFEAAITHSPDGAVLAERDGTVLEANPAFARLLDPTRPVPDNFFACLPPEPARHARTWIDREPGGSMPALETPLVGAGPAVQTVEITHALLPLEGRTVVLYTLRDVTERKTLERQLLRSQRIELLGEVAGSVIHDLGNLLNVVSGSAQMLRRKAGLEVQPHVDRILASAEGGAGLLRQLLMFARGEDAVLAPASPADVTAEVVRMVQGTFGRFHPVQFEAEPNLPRVRLDPTQVHQILMNFCVNARDAMPDGGPLTVRVERREVAAGSPGVLGDLAAGGDYVAISVRDAGTGIPPEVLPRLFDPFFTTKPKGQGTGLGLATVLRLMRRHNGFVTLETEVGRGSCFTCHFPVAPGPTA
jgi:signal transduction histidine kinase